MLSLKHLGEDQTVYGTMWVDFLLPSFEIINTY